MTTVSQSIGAITVSGTNSAPGEPITYTLSSSIGQVAGLTADDILNATYVPDPTDPAYTIVTFGNGKITKTSNAKAKSIQLSADSAINSISDQLDNPAPAPPSTNPTSPTTPGGTGSPTNANTLTGPASGDSGASKGTTGNNPTNPKGTTGGSPGSPGAPGTSKNGTTPPNASNPSNNNASINASPFSSSTQPTDSSQPGKRLNNPLGQFASYTYQLSLYMITPDAYDLFIASGRTKINAFNEAVGMGAGPTGGGVFLVAQSGGINNTNEQRAAGFNFDYYIDNLIIDVETSGKSSATATNISEIKFTITEPYGFSFVSNLKKSSEAINQYTKTLTTTPPENPSKQFFILGIRFYGYDQSGRLVTPGSDFNGASLDPNSKNGSLFEHFYDISINQIDFKIDGKMTTYQCTASSISAKAAFGIKNGLLVSAKNVTGSTVGDMLNTLMGYINEEQQKLAAGPSPAIEVPAVYSVTFAPGAEIIRDSTVITQSDIDKSKFPGSGATNTAASTDATGVAVTVNKNKRNIAYAANTPILQCIEQTIKYSSYLTDAMKAVFNSENQSDPKKNAYPITTPGSSRPLSWYTCTPSVSGAKWDNKQKEWVFNINYTINKYDTPVVTSTYVKEASTFYGPHKRYDYWYTGLNNEILSYEQTLNNAYFTVDLGATTADAAPAEGTSNTNSPQTPTAASVKPAADPSNKLGQGATAQNSYITSIYDAGSLAEAQISILGDPDYLIETSTAASINQVYSQFYGTDGYTINPNGGQVFIEIDFKEGVDYVMGGGLNADGSSTPGGTLNINNSILFWQYPPSVANIVQGISYQVIKVENSFKGGSFKQNLSLVINDFGQVDTGNQGADANNPADPRIVKSLTGSLTKSTGPTTSSSAATTQTTGTGTAKPAPSGGSNTPASATGGAPPKQTPNQGTTPTGPNGAPVANGDATGN
jgi:hypothetical protein